MLRTVTMHLRFRPGSLLVLAAVTVSFALLIPREAFAGPIEDRLREALERLDTRDLRTGVLYDRVLPLSGIERFDGDGRAVASRDLWRQLYEELRRASADPGQRPPVEALIARARGRQDAVPLAVVFDGYERIRRDALERGAIEIRDGRLLRGNGEAFEVRTAFAAAALREWTYRGTEVRFVLDRRDYFSNRGAAAPRLEADLDDGLGFRTMSFDLPLTARYARTGTKTLRLRATTADGATVETALAFSVRALAAPAPNDTIHVTGTIPYLGGVASGDAYVYLAPGRTQLQNPAVVVEGFDLYNDMNWDELYALLNQENLIETLRADGYDAVMLNFADATEYLQRNAFVVVELLQQIRDSVGPQRSMALAGASMGGLVSRYALAYMESNGFPHSVRTFISFDTPHMGANIPLGIQYWVKFFSGQSSDAAVFLGLLDRPAARQMLVYHYTDPAGTNGQADPLRGAFATDLAAVGDWPSQPRLVAIANGSDNGTGEPFAPGAQIVQWSYSDLFVAITGHVWAVPNVTSTKIFDGRLRILFSTTTQAVTVNGTQPYDNAPGGWRASMAQLDSVAAPYGDIVALHNNHCFIPTVSALAYNTSDLFHNIAADPDPVSNTPFDAIYSQGTNQEHVAITPQNAAWIRNEVEAGVTGVNPIAGLGVHLRTPWPNPSSGPVRIAFSLARPEAVDLRVFSVDGRQVANLARGVWGAGSHQVAWSGRDSRGTLTGSGVYFVRFATEDGVQTRRVVRFR
ncbi:MAG TPA: T9SS type A sorting domain-containing protein [Acidobacteriota bacterium]|nr:T9SS type A sorting domain-containing protein [Acidobacteriota bacterium]